MNKNLMVLLVDDDEDEYVLIKDLFAHLPGQGNGFRYRLEWVDSYEKGLEACASRAFDVHLVDYYLGSNNGLELMRAAEACGCVGPFILLTGQGSYDLDVAAMQQGVADYLVKSQLNEWQLERSIRYALERKEIQDGLELRVQERTRELAEANRELHNEIERRKQAEETLRESEARFRTLAETTSAAIFIVQEARIRYANPATRFVTGYEPADLVGKELWRLAHPDYREPLKQSRMTNAWARGYPARYEIKILNRAGEERWVDVTTGSMTYNGGPAWLLTAFDVTERFQAERDLRIAKDELEQRVVERTQEAERAALISRQRADELDGLHRATAALLSTLDFDDLLSQILDAAQSAIPAAERGMLHLVSPGTGELQVRATLGFSSERIRIIHSPRSQLYPARVARERRPQLIRDVQQTGSPEGEPEEMRGVRSMIIAPLTYGESVLGTLSLSAGQPDAFTEANLRLLVTFAATTTAALQNALLHAEIKQLAISDPLTGPYNRRAFFDLGRREVERYQRFNHPLAAIMIDLDNLKQINDTYGHNVGDDVLRNLAERCRGKIRETDIFGRYGGDEFTLLLPDTDLAAAVQIAERIREAIGGVPWVSAQGLVAVSVSIGVAAAKKRHRTLEELLVDADRALYRAKANGRNRVEAFQ